MGRAQNQQAAVVSVPRRAAVAAANIVPLPDIKPDEDWFQPDPAVLLEAKQVARALDCDPIIATRLIMRGLSAQAITDYLNPGPQHIAFPDDTVPGMTDAAKELARSVENGEKVAIYADYDVDGQTSLAIISDTLAQYDAEVFSGSASASTGFGLTRAFVEQAHAEGAKWLVTVDCGSTQTQPIRLAQDLGMQVIVIDHHDTADDNTAEYHLNPRTRAQDALKRIHHAFIEAKAFEGTRIRQKWEPTVPYEESLNKLTEISREGIEEILGADYFQQLRDEIRKFGHPTNTGSMLTWKFCAAFHLAHHETPNQHWGTPLYLAGLGAIADMAPCDDQEVRAFVRVPTDETLQRDYFENRKVVPLGVSMLADALDEDPDRPDTLIRTRALLNLPKRTTEIDPRDIQTILRSTDGAQLAALIPEMVSNYERLSAIRRDQMDPMAMQQVEAARAAGEDTYFNYAQLAGFEDYSGYARMTANTLARKTNHPTLVFTRKGVDEYGQELWKFSGANDCVPGAKLGDLIPRLQEACTVQGKDWLGNDAMIPNVGGHTAVVSGVCTTDRIEDVKRVCEEWAGELDHKKKWHPIDNKRPRVFKRKVHPARFRRLEREAQLLYPLKFPENPAVQVSVVGDFKSVQPDTERGTGFTAMMSLEDGTQRRVSVSEDAATILKDHPRQKFEVVVALGGVGRPFISKLVAA